MKRTIIKEADEMSSVTWEVKDEDLNKSETLSFKHSKHSFERASQRHINDQNIALVIEYGTEFFKQGLIFYALGENNLPAGIKRKCGKKNMNIVVVIAGDSNTILTCYRSKNPLKHLKKKQKNLVTEYAYSA